MGGEGWQGPWAGEQGERGEALSHEDGPVCKKHACACKERTGKSGLPQLEKIKKDARIIEQI